MKSIRCACAMCRGIGQGIDDLQLLDDRAGPTVRDDERQRAFVLRTNVNKMNVQPIDLGDELRNGIQLRLDLAPVVVCRPIAREFLDRLELHALRCIRDRFPFRPPQNVQASFLSILKTIARMRSHLNPVNSVKTCRTSKAAGSLFKTIFVTLTSTNRLPYETLLDVFAMTRTGAGSKFGINSEVQQS